MLHAHWHRVRCSHTVSLFACPQKNATQKLIILYDSDETSRIGLECAALFLQKGFSNIFLLTGGLRHFALKYWDRCVGDKPPGPPPAPVERVSVRGGSVSQRSQAIAGTPASSRPSARGTTAAGNSSAASSRPLTGASTASSAASSYRPHMQPSQFASQGANPATSLSSHRGNMQQQLSPREQLARSQQSQQRE